MRVRLPRAAVMATAAVMASVAVKATAEETATAAVMATAAVGIDPVDNMTVRDQKATKSAPTNCFRLEIPKPT